MASEEETLRRLVVELQILEGTAEALQGRLNLVSAALTELRIANMTLQGLGEEKKDALLLVPIGGGSYVKAKLGSAEKAIVGLGADVAVERNLTEAKENLGNRITELEKTRASLGQQFNQVMGKIQEGRARLEELTTRLRGGARGAGVRKTEKKP